MMTFSSIEIKKFTVFNDVNINFGQGVNVIIGENGTGKTHLLKLIYADNFDTLKPESKEDIINALFYSDITVSRDFVNTIEYDGKPANYVFIPAKEMLSMSKLRFLHEEYSKDFPIDRTLVDIIKKAQILKPNTPPALAQKIAPILEKIIDGTVFMKEDGTFWIKKHNQMEIPFAMESEGFRKLGLLWQLIMNKSITKETVLLWDEPEANINPKLAPIIVDILFALASQGVQIFMATHDYTFAKYFEIRRKAEDNLLFLSLYKTDDGVKAETSESFKDLKQNSIISSLDLLMDEVIEGNMGD
ncbi:MAG: AAA family ATPase [Defluviitaleaceae bacterium]|nr:AAA family ATPase [Defluviitaleaceae bacterium]